ncbi:MAG: putative DNA-directed RNA polymerase III subunit C1, partial [Streblomastix strix]
MDAHIRIQFGMLSGEEIVRASSAKITQHNLYQYSNHIPLDGGPLDRRLGLSSKDGYCSTCGEQLSECVGHFGFLKLTLPVFHIGFFRVILTTLQCMCKYCGRVMMKDFVERDRIVSLLQSGNIESMRRNQIVKKNIEQAKKMHKCSYCMKANSQVKKVAPLKLSHMILSEKTGIAKQQLERKCSNAIKYDIDLQEHLNRAQETINPMRALELFKLMPDEDAMLIGFLPPITRPEQMILTHLPVPPAC